MSALPTTDTRDTTHIHKLLSVVYIEQGPVHAHAHAHAQQKSSPRTHT